MPPESAIEVSSAPERHLRLLPRRPIRVVDVVPPGACPAADYLAAKRVFTAACDRIEHHQLVVALRDRDLLAAVGRLDPDVVLLHAPFRKARDLCRIMTLTGGVTVIVLHGAVPSSRFARGWLQRVCDEADAVLAAREAQVDRGRHATIPLRRGGDLATWGLALEQELRDLEALAGW